MGMVWMGVAVVLATTLAMAQSPVDGEISGRITDTQGGVLPGVRVTVSDGQEPRTIHTDDGGAFRVGMLKPGNYKVSADLQGFTSVSGVVTLTSNVRLAYLRWTLRLGCRFDIVTIVLTARDAAPDTDAVVHLRIRSAGKRMLVSVRPECDGTEVEAYDVDVIRTDFAVGSAGERPAFEILTSPTSSPLTAGGEYLVLLREPGYVSGAMVALPVISGRIAAPTELTLKGMPVNEAVKTILSWARQPEPLRP